jgi:hypothetical protein
MSDFEFGNRDKISQLHEAKFLRQKFVIKMSKARLYKNLAGIIA